jgi:hypothetical protein
MCGLVGIAGPLVTKDETSIKKLLLFDSLRGLDSVGLAAVRGNGDISLAKLANDPYTFFDSGKFKATCNGMNSKVFLGHNRATTRGGTNNFNAHPFHHDHIVGAHNGTLDTLTWNRLEEAIGEKFPVDSMALIKAIAVLGIEAAIELCETGKDSHSGAWSLTWYDQNEGSMNFLRNQHRPMWLSYAKDFKRLYWASEWWMLDAMSRSEGIDLHEEGKEAYKFFPTAVDTHYKFDVGLLFTGGTKPKPTVKEIKGREPPVTAQTPLVPRSGTGCGITVTPPKTQTNSGKTQSGKVKHSPDNVLQWFGSASSPLAGLISRDQFEDLAKYGCSWCQDNIAFGDTGITVYPEQNMILCATCSGHTGEVTTETPSRVYLAPTQFEAMR